MNKQFKLFFIISSLIFFISCYSGVNPNGPYSIGGTVTGLNGTLVIQNNSSDDLTITTSGDFIFSTQLFAGTTFSVSILTSPTGQTCTVNNGSGTVSSNVTSIAIICSTDAFSVGGTVTGLSGTIEIQNNSSDTTTISADGSFTFSTKVASGAEYNVTILTEPDSQICSVTNGSGTITSDITNVVVSCANKRWAKTVVTGPESSYFLDSSLDSSGNIYTVGSAGGFGRTYNFGGISSDVRSPYFDNNALLVKYSPEGIAQWANIVETAQKYSIFYGVSVDPVGDVYAVGYISTTLTFNFGGTSTDLHGAYSGNNPVIVKFSSDGIAEWSRSDTSGTNYSYFNGVTSDADGNAYAVGNIYGTSAFGFGSGVTVTGKNANANVLIVKYDTNGTTKWAKTVDVGPDSSIYNDAIIDSDGNLFVAGTIIGTGTYDFGDGVTAAGKATGSNALLIKYNSEGVAQWAKTVTTASQDSSFVSISLDAAGNIFAGGTIKGSSAYNFGGISADVTGAYSGGNNAVVVKYDSTGAAQWARSTTTAAGASSFNDISANDAGDVFAAGSIFSNGVYNFGGVSADINGVASGVINAVVVKYDSDGTAQWAYSAEEGTGASGFVGISAESDGYVYPVGSIYGTNPFDFGGGSESVTGTYFIGSSVLIVRYNQF